MTSLRATMIGVSSTIQVVRLIPESFPVNFGALRGGAPTVLATLFVAVTTVAAGGILAIVILHMLAN